MTKPFASAINEAAARVPYEPPSVINREAMQVMGWGGALMLLAVALAATFFTYATTVTEVTTVWRNSVNYQFCWVVMPVFLYLLWHRRRDFLDCAIGSSLWGIGAGAMAVTLWLAADILNIAVGRQFALIAIVWALTLAALGTSVFRRALPLLALLLFMVPAGDFLITPLRHLTVNIIGAFATVSGLSFRTEGFAVFIETNRYVIIDDCAGLPYLLMAMFLSMVLALMIYRTWWKIALLTLFGGALAIVGNGIRVISIVTWDHLTGKQMELAGHVYFEWASMAVIFAILFVVFARLDKETHTPARDMPAGESALRRIAILLPTTLLVVGMPLLSATPSGALAMPTAPTLPDMLADWNRTPTETNWRPVARGEGTASVVANYRNGERKIAVFIALVDDPRAKVSAGVDLETHGKWMPSTDRMIEVCNHNGCEWVRHIKLLLKKTKQVRHLYVTYEVNGITTVSVAELRLRRAWSRLADGTRTARLIALATNDNGSLTEMDVATLFRELKH